jgi:hypothetical protein
MPQTQNFYSQSPFLGSVGDFATAANLPNVSGSTTLLAPIQQWDTATVLGVPYVCYTPTSGSAVWFKMPPLWNPWGFDVIQTVNAASATINPETTRVIVTYAAGACTLTLPTVAAGCPIGKKIVVQKANTSANGIVMTPDSGASINGAAADATQALVGANATASTVVSAAATNDISAVFTRNGALTWRSSIC